MTYERDGLLLPPRQEAQPDSELLASFEVARRGAPETYTSLALPAEQQAEALAHLHQGANADLRATHLADDDLQTRLDSLQSWKRELIARTDLDDDDQQLYRWKVNEEIANTKMLISSKQGDMRSFQRLNEFIYDKPDEITYRAALDWVAHDADILLAVDNQKPAIIEAATSVKELLAGKRGYRELLPPDPDVFQAVRQDHYKKDTGYFVLLLAGVAIPEGKINNEVGDPILRHVVQQNLHSTYKVADAAGATWSVAHTSEEVKRPKTYNMPSKRFVGLGLGHETGSHLLEKENGTLGPLALLAVGLDRTELGNEGRAVIREQVPYETFDEFGALVRWRDILRRDIVIGFGVGVGETEPQPSSKVYDFLHTIDTMYQAKLTPDDATTTHQKAQAKTDSLILRVLKGTDGTGGAYLKDKVYLEGHVANWLAAATHGPAVIANGDLGKYDITNDRHIEPLKRKGLLPEDDV